jgi:hypothetical protein
MATAQHRATVRAGPSGLWRGGCAVCGVGSQETWLGAAMAWCDGHDAAVARARHVAATHPPFFAPTGPGEAITLAELRRVIDVATTCLELLGHTDVEVLQPADQIPWLYLWTPPTTEDGWQRTRLGGLYIERRGEFIPGPTREAWAG